MPVTPLEYVGSIHIFLGPYRGNPISLYLRRNGDKVVISPKVYPFNSVVGEAETPNKAAADFEEKWKAKGLVTTDMYDGPSWEGGIKPERPAPPKAVGKPPAAAGPGPSGGGPKPPGTPSPATTPAAAASPRPAQAAPAQPNTPSTPSSGSTSTSPPSSPTAPEAEASVPAVDKPSSTPAKS